MPVRNFIILLALLVLCMGIAVVAWLSGSELYLTAGRGRPPTHPAIILAMLAVAAVFCVRLHFAAVAIAGILAFGICLGIPMGLARNWTPTIPQYLLAVALVAATCYGFAQRYYLDE
jgi:hypothetical protein